MRFTDDQVAALGRRVAALAPSAYAPYSGFHVAAIALTADGAEHGGINMENASYGLTLCAEVGALSAATLAGDLAKVSAIAVIGGRLEGSGLSGDQPVLPCGRCRQLIFESAALQGRDIPIFAFSGDLSRVERTSIHALLPNAFGPAALEG
jgi:cytidine deaminase